MLALQRLRVGRGAPRGTPLGVAGRGLLAGLAAALLLSVLSRILPGMSNRPRGARDASAKNAPPPDDPFDRRQVENWQARAQSPGAQLAQNGSPHQSPEPGRATPAAVLTLPQAPGPEGLAEQFAFKIASGVFGHDISHALRPAGLATHLTYGSLWGALFGLVQATYRRRPLPFGALYGLAVWLAGPVLLVPAMKLMRPPWQEPPLRAAMMVAGHLAYGVAVAAAFEALEEAA